MVDIVTLYDSLVDATFRGIPFCIPDIRHEIGRRVQRFLFPGQDMAAFQDLGAQDGPISLRGLIVGDDYVARMQVMGQAFRQPGPATLVHPWLGELQVVARPARFTFDQAKYRLVAFEAEVWLYTPNQAAVPDTLGQVLLAVTALQTQARAMLADALAPAALTLQAVGVAERFVASLPASFVALANLQLPGALAAIAGLSVLGLPFGAGYADAVSAVIAAPALAAATAANPAIPAAIGPGDAASTATPADPASTTLALLSSAASVAALPAITPAAQALTLSTGAQILAAAVQVASDIPLTSQQDAITWRNRQDTALAGLAASAAGLAATYPASVGTLWQAIADLRAAVATDMANTIGRLPAVTAVTFPGPAPLWLIAHHFSGDTPGDMAARFADLVARNDIGQPGMVGLSPIEALV